jgi:hypothetical protein
MTRSVDYLYDLLPAVHRIRDEGSGWPLRDLLRVIGEQVNLLEGDIERLYENWFIETCDDWVVPYLGDLVGYRTLSDAGLLSDPTTTAGQRRERTLVPRRDVANTIALRRRKGTLALLEELAADVAAWPARVVEGYPLLGWTQHLDHRRPSRGQTVDLRSGDRLECLGGPFDDVAHTVDVRRPTSHRSRGRYAVPSVALFVWRIGSYAVTGTPAACIEREGAHCYTFSVLGNDTPLYDLPVAEPEPTHIAEEVNVPAPIRHRAFERRLSEHPLSADASPAYYGIGRSLSVQVQDWPKRGSRGLVPPEAIVPADLSDWHAYLAPRGKVLVDPERGRLVFAPGQSPRRVQVHYHYGFSADLGGGEYRRVVKQPAEARVYRVRQTNRGPGDHRTIEQAWRQWRRDKHAPLPDGESARRAVVIEVADSGVYEERLVFDLEPGESAQLRAAPRTRPVLRLLDYRVDQPDPFRVSGGAAARFVLDGFLVAGRGIVVAGNAAVTDDESIDLDPDQPENERGHKIVDDVTETDANYDGRADGLCDVTIRHCTLVPGWDLDCDCTPGRPDEPSLTLSYTRARVVVEHSILGSVVAEVDERRGDPPVLSISDSILDATDPDQLAVSSGDGRLAFLQLTLARSTVVGEVLVHAVDRVENSIFTSALRVARRQVGCVRFSYLPDGSRTPRRYHCQPDAAVSDAADDVRRQAERAASEGSPPGAATLAAAITRASERARDRVRPDFTSLRYGTPGYGQLAGSIAEEIWRGADDEAELGAFHDLFQPQRTANMRARLDEYTPAGMDTGLFFSS